MLGQNNHEIPLMIARAINANIDDEVPSSTIVYEFDRLLPDALATAVLSEYYCSCCQLLISDKKQVKNSFIIFINFTATRACGNVSQNVDKKARNSRRRYSPPR